MVLMDQLSQAGFVFDIENLKKKAKIPCNSGF